MRLVLRFTKHGSQSRGTSEDRSSKSEERKAWGPAAPGWRRRAKSKVRRAKSPQRLLLRRFVASSLRRFGPPNVENASGTEARRYRLLRRAEARRYSGRAAPGAPFVPPCLRAFVPHLFLVPCPLSLRPRPSALRCAPLRSRFCSPSGQRGRRRHRPRSRHPHPRLTEPWHRKRTIPVPRLCQPWRPDRRDRHRSRHRRPRLGESEHRRAGPRGRCASGRRRSGSRTPATRSRLSSCSPRLRA